MDYIYAVTNTDYKDGTTRLFMIGSEESVKTHLASYGRTISYYNPYAQGRTSIAKPCNLFLVDKAQYRELTGGSLWGNPLFPLIEGSNMQYVDLKASYPEAFV